MGACWALHNLSNLKIILATATFISWNILIFTHYLLSMTGTAKNLASQRHDTIMSKKNVIKLNVETVNYHELVADLASDRFWILPCFSWKFGISCRIPMSSLWHSRNTLVPRLETKTLSYYLCNFLNIQNYIVLMNTHKIKI